VPGQLLWLRRQLLLLLLLQAACSMHLLVAQ
jgi:hypothetical protein